MRFFANETSSYERIFEPKNNITQIDLGQNLTRTGGTLPAIFDVKKRKNPVFPF